MTDPWRALAAAADELHRAPSVDAMLHRAVQFARSHLGVERCRVFLHSDGTLQGTYGIDRHGDIAEEHSLHITNGAHWISRLNQPSTSDAAWTVIEDGNFAWDTPQAATSGWIALTPLRAGQKLVGIFVNDCALSGRALDPTTQEVIAVYCSLLGTIIEAKRASATPATAPALSAAEQQAASDEARTRRSKDLFTKVVHACPVPVAIIALNDGVFLDVNARYLELMGYTRDELIGQSISSDRAPMSTDERARIGAALREHPMLRDFAAVLRTRNGDERSVHLSVERIELNDEPCILALIDDVTDRKLAEQALSDERSLLRTVIDTLPDYIFAKDLNGRFIMSNAAHARAANVLDPDAFIGKQAADFFPQDLAAQFDADDHEVLITGTPSLNLERVTQNGANNPIIVSTTKVPLRDVQGNTIGLVGISRDITAHKQASEALQEAHDELEHRVEERTAELSNAIELLEEQVVERKRAEEALQEAHDKLELRVEERTAELRIANEEVKRFAYIVSHDLRAPLVNIQGFSNELQASLDLIESVLEPACAALSEAERARVTATVKQDVPEALGFIHASVERMNYLINAILKFSRLGERPLQHESIRTGELVRAIIQSLGHQIAEREATVTVGMLPDITADRTAMEQIFGNILSNAVLYLDPARPGQIEISGEMLARETMFHIRDNGRGIAAEDGDKVFELFRRAGNSQVQGEGMGLAYVQALLRRHEGRIWFESEPGVGTTFSFAVPHIQIEEAVGA